jgi:hypothetical protein
MSCSGVTAYPFFEVHIDHVFFSHFFNLTRESWKSALFLSRFFFLFAAGTKMSIFLSFREPMERLTHNLRAYSEEKYKRFFFLKHVE